MSDRFTVEQVLDQLWSVQYEYSASDDETEAEAEDVSEEEDVVEYNAERETSSSAEEEEGDADLSAGRLEDRRGQRFLSKDGKVWSSVPHGRGEDDAPAARRDAPPPPLPPVGGPTPYAVSNAHDIASTFALLITAEIEEIVLAMTNLQGVRKYGQEWKKGIDETDLRAYIGLLILAGVYRSRGEAAASLWDAESGRAIFRATMPLKVFHGYSRLLRFDDLETRPARRSTDKLAAIREVWDKWAARLPLLYNPGPDVTVDEQLVPFRGRCPFRQYIPSKPAKYGIKFWAACDARSSYAWKMQVYTGKPIGGAVERNQGMRVVLDVTEGLRGRNVTCDNFFTSYELGQRLLRRDMTMLGTVRQNKPELPKALLATKGREVFSSTFAFTDSTAVVCYIPKRNKKVLLMSTRRRDHHQDKEARISERRDRKPALVLDYNSTKGGVDNLDKVIGTYSCRRMTRRWPLVVFHNLIDVSSYNAFVIWRELNPSWLSGKRNKRRVFLERLGKQLVAPLIRRRARFPRTVAAADVVRANTDRNRDRDRDRDRDREDHHDPPRLAAESDSAAADGSRTRKRKRCEMCTEKKDRKTRFVCRSCRKYICGGCSVAVCGTCAGAL
ncbi:piggyBac transposable element-derived protein 4-like [Scomber japonicus]|uniref:piggyBac transposable element-derived protein 4-like n=1 Tax=Scomber japonicus TaxID=13676 RepID=UPI002306B12D|nr:piggyBac transposable element-derived protein 4-like [Scomber japonicus]XP_053171657.1 piggyBac transposable element-derived protein 4-like [Scomber japonicus]XP_053171661.1 piggyBac transposable element-derived protein 4-like [Scomber japonicus]